MGEIKPGCLALVVGCVRNPINIGKLVTVVEYAHCGHEALDGSFYGQDQGGWYCTGDDLYCGKFFGPPVRGGYTYVDSCHLMPINPSADPLEQTQEQEQTA